MDFILAMVLPFLLPVKLELEKLMVSDSSRSLVVGVRSRGCVGEC